VPMRMSAIAAATLDGSAISGLNFACNHEVGGSRRSDLSLSRARWV